MVNSACIETISPQAFLFYKDFFNWNRKKLPYTMICLVREMWVITLGGCEEEFVRTHFISLLVIKNKWLFSPAKCALFFHRIFSWDFKLVFSNLFFSYGLLIHAGWWLFDSSLTLCGSKAAGIEHILELIYIIDSLFGQLLCMWFLCIFSIVYLVHLLLLDIGFKISEDMSAHYIMIDGLK